MTEFATPAPKTEAEKRVLEPKEKPIPNPPGRPRKEGGAKRGPTTQKKNTSSTQKKPTPTKKTTNTRKKINVSQKPKEQVEKPKEGQKRTQFAPTRDYDFSRFISDIFYKCGKFKYPEERVDLLKAHPSPAITTCLIANFDESLSLMVDIEKVKYNPNKADRKDVGTYGLLRDDYKYLHMFYRGGSDLTIPERHDALIKWLGYLHKDEAELVVLVMKRRLTPFCKMNLNQISQVYPDFETWLGGRDGKPKRQNPRYKDLPPGVQGLQQYLDSQGVWRTEGNV